MPHSRTPVMVSLTVAGVSRMVRCWSIFVPPSTTLRYTEHNRDLIVDGARYKHAGGTSLSSRTDSSESESSVSGVRGVIKDDSITEAMIRSGALDGAVVSEFSVDWLYPFAGKTGLYTYRLGERAWNEQSKTFSFDLVGLIDRLKQKVGLVYSRKCPWQLGDANCGVDLTEFTTLGNVSSVVGATEFNCTIDTPRDAKFYDDGVVTWTSGANIGHKSVVRTYELGRIVLNLIPPYPINSGDDFTLTASCNKMSGVYMDATGTQPVSSSTNGEVTSIVNSTKFRMEVDDEKTPNFYSDGEITWTSGANNGEVSRVRTYFIGSIVLYEAPPNPVAVGDDFVLRSPPVLQDNGEISYKDDPVGHCKHRYNNLENFGGFPYMPTNDTLYKAPGGAE